MIVLNPGNLSRPGIAGIIGGLIGLPAISIGMVMYVGSSVIRHVSGLNSAGTTMRVLMGSRTFCAAPRVWRMI